MEFVYELFRKLPPLSAKKNPNLACFIGLLTGGLGLGVYFFSVVDAVIPVAIALFITHVSYATIMQDPFLSFLAGCSIAALYGYLRATESNSRLEPAN